MLYFHTMKWQPLLILVFLILSCNGKIDDQGNVSSESILQPEVFELKFDSLLTHNVLTGEEIPSVVTIDGDTLWPGTVYNLDSQIINLNDFPAPTVSTIQEVKQLTFQNQNSEINASKPDEIPFVWVDKTSGKNKEHFTDYLLTNSNGKKVQTGVPLKLEGKKSEWIQQKPVQALPMALPGEVSSNIQFLDVDQGLNSSYILCIMEDRSQNLWFGSYGGGLARYNGSTITLFNEAGGLSRDIVRVIFEDSNGNIWIGTTGGGLCKFDGNSFVSYSEPQGMPADAIVSIFEDSQKNLWFGGTRGVTKYDGEYFTHYSEKEGLSHNAVISICEDQNGHLWFGTESNITRLANGKFEVIELPFATDQDKWVLSVLATDDGAVWFTAVDLGVFKFKDDKLYRYHEKQGLLASNVWSMEEDQFGNIWFGTYGNGIHVFDGKTFKNFTDNNGIFSRDVRTIYADKQGNLWFGSYGNGVLKYNRNSFIHFDEDDGLTNGIARSIIEDTKGDLWFGTSGGGVCKYDGTSFYSLQNEEDFDKTVVKAICQTRDNSVWIGSNGQGLCRYRDGKLTTYKKSNGFPADRILAIYEDCEQNLWVGTDGFGVCRCDRDVDGNITQIINFREELGLSMDIVVNIYQDKDSAMWFVTDGGGLNKYKNGKVQNINEANGLANRNTLAFTQDQNGNYWTGSYGGGISVFDEEHVIHINESNGLVNNMIWSIKEIRDSNQSVFWVTTERGINLIELHTGSGKSVADYQFKIHRFLKQDGLLGLDYYANSVCYDSQNRIWWGSGKGVEMLDLNTFQISQNIPEPSLEYIEINEQFIDFRNEKNENGELLHKQVVPFLNYPENLTLSSEQNHLTFYFSAIDWKAPHKIAYQFRMVGLNENWSSVNSKNQADYRSIPYGEYTFQVRAIGESQIWSEPFSYSFEILPPWWHTWWFRFLVVAFVLILFYAFYRFRTAALMQQQRVLESTVKERTAEVVQQKELIEEKHREITDSINYAERIQKSFLATNEILNENLQEYFVFFQPKDVVSGDFYWAAKLENGNFALCCADSTGHGVPGAIMSILNISSLEKSIEKETEPDKILNETRKIIIERLKKDGSAEGGKDGMDCSLVVLSKDRKTLSFAGAHNPVFLVNYNTVDHAFDLKEFTADKMPVGKHEHDYASFNCQKIDLNKGDMVYMVTDGFADQFGGENNKKYMIKNLKTFLTKIASLPVYEQEKRLSKEFETWKGNTDQIDDVCIVGFRI